MSGFDDVAFPMKLALAATGGPERKVEVVTLASGAEVRNAVWAGSRRRWDVGSAITDLASLQTVVAFFEARGGKLRSFRFRDGLDDRSCGVDGVPLADDQVIGVGDGEQTTFALVKDYGGHKRVIARPVAGSVVVAVDGAIFAVMLEGGRVVFDVPPPLGATVRAGFIFDCAVRFDADRLDVNLEAFGAGRIVSVPLVEVVEG